MKELSPRTRLWYESIHSACTTPSQFLQSLFKFTFPCTYTDILFRSSRRHQPSPPPVMVSLTLWQRRVPWGRKFTAPIGFRPATATTCRKVANTSTRSPKTKRLAARSASVKFQIGPEKSYPFVLSLPKPFKRLGDVRMESM